MSALEKAVREWLRFDNEVEPPNDDHTYKQMLAYARRKEAITEAVAAALDLPYYCVRPEGAMHPHDCDRCTFIGSYRKRYPQVDEDGYDTGIVGNLVTMSDVWLSCDNSGYRYIVRYGKDGAYATTNDVSRYVLAPLINGEDQYA